MPSTEQLRAIRTQTAVVQRLVFAALFVMWIAAYARAAERGDLSQRVLQKETLIRAPRLTLWWAWTTSDGLATFFGEKDTIELRNGGPFEILFSTAAPEGQRGSEGCQVLAYLPGEMLSFTWNAPPSIPALREA